MNEMNKYFFSIKFSNKPFNLKNLNQDFGKKFKEENDRCELKNMIFINLN